MSALKRYQANRIKQRRARIAQRLAVQVEWQTGFLPALMTPLVKRAAALAWLGEGKANVTVSFVSAEQSQALNNEWRGKDKSTNILSFPFELPEGWEEKHPFLGDLIVCVPVVQSEAESQQKTMQVHMAHLIVHGMLHLQGYDHEQEDAAQEMEQLETHLLAQLGINDPYTIVE